MKPKTRSILLLLFAISTVITASAQAGRVSLRPVFKPGQEYRYAINGSVDTNVTPAGPNGIASLIHRETAATVVIRGIVGATGDSTVEAVIEAIATRTTVDGVERPAAGNSLAGQKIEYRLDSEDNLMKVRLPETAPETGLPQLLFSLGRWAPQGEVAIGQTWGQSPGAENLAGNFEYIALTTIAEISKRAAVAYKLSSIGGSKALIEGAITLSQSGTSLLTTKDSRIDVVVIATGNGKTTIEFDVAASRIASITTETSIEGRLSTTPPKGEGEKLQPRESKVVETAKTSVKLVQ